MFGIIFSPTSFYRKLIIIGLVIAYSCMVTGCGIIPGRSKQINVSSANLEDLVNLEKSTIAANKEYYGIPNEFKSLGLRQIATSLGARAGLYHRSQEINNFLMSKENKLSKVFDFNALMIDGHIVPPVLLESINTLQISSDQHIRLANHNYKIIHQAHLATVAPHWHEYLLTSNKKPEVPEESLLPKTKYEKLYWREALEEGWKQGIKQADMIFADNLMRLKRDYQGMILYRILLAKNMVSRPHLVQRNFGVTGGGEEMSINDRMLEITALPSLKANSKTWQPVIANLAANDQAYSHYTAKDAQKIMQSRLNKDPIFHKSAKIDLEDPFAK